MKKFDPNEISNNEIDRITLRVSHKEKETLAQIAQEKGISLNTLLVRCINFALDSMEQKQKIKKC